MTSGGLLYFYARDGDGALYKLLLLLWDVRGGDLRTAKTWEKLAESEPPLEKFIHWKRVTD